MVAVQVGTNPSVPTAVADVRVNCSDGSIISYDSVVGSPVYAAMPADTAAGFSSLTGIAGASALVQLAGVPASAAGFPITMACTAGSVVIGLQLQAVTYSNSTTQQLISLVASCAAPADVTCAGVPVAACTPGWVRGADTGACEACPPGTFQNTTADVCQAW